MRTRTRHRKKGMTALQAAILTGVSIAVALIVGYWIWTVVVGSIRTERISLTIPTAEFNNNQFTITLTLKNVGPSDTTIVDVRVNGRTYGNWNGTATFGSEDFNSDSGITVRAGQAIDVTITLNADSYTHGQTIEIAFVTASNQVYTSSIALP